MGRIHMYAGKKTVHKSLINLDEIECQENLSSFTI